VAILFANGMSPKAIQSQVLRSTRDVEFWVHRVYEKMSASLNVPLTGLGRRDMLNWLSGRGLLPVEGDLEAILTPTISALEASLNADGWLQPYERNGVEKDLAQA
jgi:hypothetical protein